MKETIALSVQSVIEAANCLNQNDARTFIYDAALTIARAYEKGRKVLIAGNGGSLCDAMHFAEELTGIYRKKRKALPAIALSDPGHMSCIANDIGYDEVFSRAVEAYGNPGDVFIALTTSGNSKNLINACMQAKQLGLTTIAFLGKDGGDLNGMCDLQWIVKGFPYSDRIQEAHMAAIHIVIEVIEYQLFQTKAQMQYAKETL